MATSATTAWFLLLGCERNEALLDSSYQLSGLFQCRDADSKAAWLAAYDEAKALQRTGGQPQPGTFTRMESLRPKRKVADVNNPFGEPDDEEEDEEGFAGDLGAAVEPELPEWLVELA